MKKVTLTIVLVICSQLVYSQGILDRINKKIGINININPNGNQTNNSNSTHTESNNNTSDSSTPTFNFSGLGQNNKCKVEKEYTFQTAFVSDFYSYTQSGKGKSKDSFSMQYSLLFENSGFYMGTKVNDISNQKDFSGMQMIISMRDSCIISLIDSKESKIGMSLSYKGNNDKSNHTSLPNFVKTGKTKTILGQLCFEYIAEDETLKQTHWISEKDSKVWDIYYKNGYNTIPQSNIKGLNASKIGIPLESIIEHKKEKTINHIFVREIKKNQNIKISSEGYIFY
ncbi:MAG: hypothetical protein J5I91_05330 [Bacteroidetes bacterium]|nr:hypothetical protein [Bacteroidota bacterium]